MTTYMLMSDTGNALDCYDNEEDAREVLNEVVYQEPDCADRLAVLAFDETGHAFGKAILPDVVIARNAGRHAVHKYGAALKQLADS